MYSNCLIEAIKAKIKDPKNVYLFRVPKEVNKIRHFMWKKGDKYYHVSQSSEMHWWNYLLHEVKFKEIPDYVFDTLVVNRTIRSKLKTKKKVAKATASNFAKIGKDWESFLPEDNLEISIKKNDVEYFEKVLKMKAKFKIATYEQAWITDYEGLLEATKGKKDFAWKLIDYFDDDFDMFYLNRQETNWAELE